VEEVCAIAVQSTITCLTFYPSGGRREWLLPHRVLTGLSCHDGRLKVDWRIFRLHVFMLIPVQYVSEVIVPSFLRLYLITRSLAN
jgi:hypothetical protein